jgi:hypothetical protein
MEIFSTGGMPFFLPTAAQDESLGSGVGLLPASDEVVIAGDDIVGVSSGLLLKPGGADGKPGGGLIIPGGGVGSVIVLVKGRTDAETGG